MSDTDNITDETADISQEKRVERSFLSGLLLGMAKFVIFLSALLALIIAAGSIAIYQAGGLKQIAQQQLSIPEIGLQTIIGDVDFHFALTQWRIDAEITDIIVTAEEQQLHLPQLTLRASPSLLIKGQPLEATLSGLSIDLVQAENELKLAGEWGRWQRFFAESVNEDGIQSGGFISFLAQRQLALQDMIISLRKQDSDAQIALSDLDAVFQFDNAGGIRFFGGAKLSSSDNATMHYSGQINILSGLTDMAVETTKLAVADFAPFLPDPLKMLSELGQIDTKISLVFDQSQLQSAAGVIQAKDGSLPVSLTSGRTAPFKELAGDISYSRPDDYLVIDDVALSLPDGRKMQFSADIAGLSQPNTLFDGQLLIEELAIDSLLSQWPEAALSDVRSYMIESFSGGEFETLAAIFKGQLNKTAKEVTLSELSLNGEIDDVRVKTGYGQYKELVGTAKGRLSLDVVSGGQLQSARLKLGLSDGYVITEASSQPIKFDKAAGEIIFQPGQLLVPDVQFQFANGSSLSSTISMSLDENGNPTVAQFSVTSPQMPIEDIKALWPQNLVKKTADFVSERLSGGMVSDFSLAMTVGFTTHETGFKQTINALETRLALSDTDFLWLPSRPALRGVSGEITLRDNVVGINITDGADRDLVLESAEIFINPAIQPAGKNRLLTMRLTANAPMPQVTELLADKTINQLERVPFSLADATGNVRSRLHLTADLKSGEKPKFQLISADATITDGAFSNVFQGFDLSQADLVVNVMPSQLEVTGSGLLDNVPGVFSLKNDDDNLRLTGNLTGSPYLSEMAANLSGQEITGILGGRFTIDVEKQSQKTRAFGAVNLKEAGVNLPLLNWAKLPGEAGQASAAFHFDKGQLMEISAISIDAGGLRATGNLALNQDGSLADVSLDNVSWPGNMLDTISISPRGDGVLHVVGEGALLDLRSVRKGEGVSEGRHLSFDLTANRMLIEDNVDLYGQMVGEVRSDGNGDATLQGALIINNNALLEQGTIEAYFGPDGEYLSAVGLIGGAEARLEFSPSENDGPLLIITSQNAGRVLAGLGITDTIRSGRLILMNEFKDGDFSEYDTTINLEEFNVIEAPAAVRAFSVLGLAGLYSLVEGDGTRFTRGEAFISTKGDDVEIKHMRASGGAVGVTMLGRYNRQTKQVDVSGNLVPANQFSKIIGAVPVLGEILSGIDKSGVFSTQFNLKGPISEPETTVNVASLAPGLIRDIFSPNWLGRERGRILGDDEDTGQ